MIIEEKTKLGFEYTVEVVAPDGTVSQRETVHNLIPQEGVDHVMSVMFKGATAPTAWFIGLFEGNFTPTTALTAATFPAAATECTAYEGQRKEFTPGAVSAGAVSNTDSRAEFTFTGDKTIYGGVVSTAATPGATTGVLISAVRFSTPKVLSTGSVLRVLAGVTLVSSV